jgi:hypothetical protein
MDGSLTTVRKRHVPKNAPESFNMDDEIDVDLIDVDVEKLDDATFDVQLD